MRVHVYGRKERVANLLRCIRKSPPTSRHLRHTHVHQLGNGLVVLPRGIQQVGFAQQHRHGLRDVAPLHTARICFLPAHGGTSWGQKQGWTSC